MTCTPTTEKSIKDLVSDPEIVVEILAGYQAFLDRSGIDSRREYLIKLQLYPLVKNTLHDVYSFVEQTQAVLPLAVTQGLT